MSLSVTKCEIIRAKMAYPHCKPHRSEPLACQPGQHTLEQRHRCVDSSGWLLVHCAQVKCICLSIQPLDFARVSREPGIISQCGCQQLQILGHSGQPRLLWEYKMSGLSCILCRRPPFFVSKGTSISGEQFLPTLFLHVLGGAEAQSGAPLEEHGLASQCNSPAQSCTGAPYSLWFSSFFLKFPPQG